MNSNNFKNMGTPEIKKQMQLTVSVLENGKLDISVGVKNVDKLEMLGLLNLVSINVVSQINEDFKLKDK